MVRSTCGSRLSGTSCRITRSCASGWRTSSGARRRARGSGLRAGCPRARRRRRRVQHQREGVQALLLRVHHVPVAARSSATTLSRPRAGAGTSTSTRTTPTARSSPRCAGTCPRARCAATTRCATSPPRACVRCPPTRLGCQRPSGPRTARAWALCGQSGQRATRAQRSASIVLRPAR